MRDKYNLNTLPPGVEEDTGNLADVNEKKGPAHENGVIMRFFTSTAPTSHLMSSEEKTKWGGKGKYLNIKVTTEERMNGRKGRIIS